MSQNFNYEEAVSGCKTMEDITGPDGLIQKIIKDAVHFKVREEGHTVFPETMLMYGKEASNRKQEIDRQHHTIPNQRNQRQALWIGQNRTIYRYSVFSEW